MYDLNSDLTDAKSADVNARRRLAELVRDACVNVGFFYGTYVSVF